MTILRNAALVSATGVTRGPLHIVGDRLAATTVGRAGEHEIDLPDHLVFPGLVNAHDHLQLNNIPPLSRGAPFPSSYAWARALQPHLATAAVAAARAVAVTSRYRQGGLKNLLSGATTVAHHDPWHAVLDEAAFPVNLLRSFGWCHSLGLAPAEGETTETQGWASALARRTERALRSLLPGAAPESRLGPYGPAAASSFAATPPDRPWIIHLAEGTDAVAGGELAELRRLGCLAPNTVLIHAVGLGGDDVAAVLARGASVVWCPASNLALLGATLDPRSLHEAGRLAIGTDSRLSGSRDLLDELRVAAAHSDLAPVDLLRLATTAASAVLRMPDVGGLAPGQRADLLIVRDTGADPYRALLELRRADIRAVVRNGAPAVADRDFAEWFEASGVAPAAVTLDGRPKLLDGALAGPEAIALEPGLELAA